MSNLRELLGLKEVVPYTSNKAVPLVSSCPSLLYGVELEIENVPHWSDLEISGMTSVEDGSLRNDGREFITKPMTFSVLAHVLNRFFNLAELDEHNYSDRTSVHVHANCQNLTVEQILSIILLYSVTERLFYAYAKEDRDKNIFCVPLHETMISSASIEPILENPSSLGKILNLKRWMKYTGLNLLPLFTYGTIEFRHLAGTSNMDHILTWCNLIGCLFTYAMNNSYIDIKKEILSLNTNSEYKVFLARLFTIWEPYICTEDFRVLLEEGVLNVKYLFIKPKMTLPEPAADFWQRAQLHELHDVVLRNVNVAPLPPENIEAQPVEGWVDEMNRDFEIFDDVQVR